jgi:hypothetical protein
MKAMKRVLLASLGSAVFAVVTAAPALADAGAPGSTFPEQPGTHVAQACATAPTSPGATQFFANGSATAQTIVLGIIADACLGG